MTVPDGKVRLKLFLSTMTRDLSGSRRDDYGCAGFKINSVMCTHKVCHELYLSVSMSNTAPNVELWLKARAALPSSSSHTKLQHRCAEAILPRQIWQSVLTACKRRNLAKAAYLMKYRTMHATGLVGATAKATKEQAILA